MAGQACSTTVPLCVAAADALQQAPPQEATSSAPDSISNQEVQVTTDTHQVLFTFPEQVIPEVKQAKGKSHGSAGGAHRDSGHGSAGGASGTGDMKCRRGHRDR